MERVFTNFVAFFSSDIDKVKDGGNEVLEESGDDMGYGLFE